MSRLSIAILSQQANAIGLFEMLRIHQTQDGAPRIITWIKAHHNPFSAWVRPEAILFGDPVFQTIRSENITLLSADFLRLNATGHIQPNQLTPGCLIRLPYNVSFWEQIDAFPVYTCTPEHVLPWVYTIQSSIRPPMLPRSYELMPLHSSPRRVAPAAPAPRAQTSSFRRVLSATSICPITMEPLTTSDAVWTPCGHAFSRAALLTALERDERCPMCRAPCAADELSS